MKKRWWWLGTLAVAVGITVGSGWYWNTHHDGQLKARLQSTHGWKSFDGRPSRSWQTGTDGVSITGGKGNKLVYPNESFTNSQVQVQVKLKKPAKSATAEDAGLLFRITQPTKGIDGYAGYYFGLDVRHQKVILGRAEQAARVTWHELAHQQMTLHYGQTYTLTVKAVGRHIQCYIDRKHDDWAKIDLTDSTYQSGMVGLRTNGANATFTNLNVQKEVNTMKEATTYKNSVLANVADPDVIYHNGTYYLYPTTTNEDAGGIKVYTSKDMVHWHNHGLAMTAGQDNWGESGFWAPNVTENAGKFYMTYTANEHLCVSVSDSPLGPFKQPQYGPMHADTKEIDAHVFKDKDGQYYLYFVRFTGGNIIYGAKLNPDMLTIDESTVTELLRPSQAWERDMADVNEGPYMLYKDGEYFLTYSGSHFESPMYGVGYATSRSPLGKFKKYVNNPIMQSNASVHGAGHHTFAPSPDGKELFIIYHTHHDLDTTDPRKLAIDRIRFTHDEKGQLILEAAGPTVTPQPVPSGAK